MLLLFYPRYQRFQNITEYMNTTGVGCEQDVPRFPVHWCALIYSCAGNYLLLVFTATLTTTKKTQRTTPGWECRTPACNEAQREDGITRVDEARYDHPLALFFFFLWSWTKIRPLKHEQLTTHA